MSSIPIADPELGTTEKERVRDVIDGGQIADGPEVRRFEEEFAAFCESSHGIATANGTTALHAALEAVGIGTGDVVVTSPFSFVATANAVRHSGGTPVFADIDPETYNLDPEAVEAVVRDHGGAVEAMIPVHLYGLPADMDPLLDLAETYDIAVIEDAAQAHGAEYRGQPVGSLGDAACFSFYPTKNMTTGEGGMIVTDRDDVAARARRFINHGRGDGNGMGYDHVDVGHNFRMTSIAAAIGRVQLENLPEYSRERRANATTLTERLHDVPGIEVPLEPAERRHVYHQYTIRSGDREGLRTRLDEAGIGNAVYYPTPIHRQPAYDHVDRTFPVAERAAREVLSLPVHPNVSESEVERVADTVHEFATKQVGGQHD